MSQEYFPIELIHENREDLRKQIEVLREDRKNKPERFKKPCVYVAMLVRAPASRANPNPQYKPVVKTINLHGGRNKTSSITNMLRRGQFPVAYDFPTDERMKALLESAKKTKTTKGDIARYIASGEDPWAEVRKFLDRTIQDTFTNWDMADLREQSELEKKALLEEKAALEKEVARLAGKKVEKKAPAKQEEADYESESEDELKKELEKSK